MLTVHEVKKHFDGVKAVDGISFEVPKGKITGLIGPNGAGKTTLFNLISGTIIPDEGQITFDGKNITRESIESRSLLGMSRTFQLARPFRNLTVADHLALAKRADDDRFFWDAFQTQETQKPSANILEQVGLEDIPLSHLAADLSYGQSKLLAIAMALVKPHALLLLDEPVAGVNPVIREKLIELIRRLHKEGETILLIEHDMKFIMPLCDHLVVMDRGKLLAQGNPDEIRTNPAVLSAYLGEQV